VIASQGDRQKDPCVLDPQKRPDLLTIMTAWAEGLATAAVARDKAPSAREWALDLGFPGEPDRLPACLPASDRQKDPCVPALQ